MTREQIRATIDAEWDARSLKVDWLGYETLAVEILRSDLPDGQKCEFLREAIDAFTRRGYFTTYGEDGA